MILTVLGYVTLTLVIAIILIQAAAFSTTIYLHRAVTHRSIILHPFIAWLCRLNIWGTLGILPKEYRAVHLEHHEHTDEEGDPHSPRDPTKGLKGVLLKNVIYYVQSKKKPGLVAKYNRDNPDDWWDTHLFNTGAVGPILGTTTLCTMLTWWLGWPGLICALSAAALHATGYIFLSACINGLCHWSGDRNWDNTATNRPFLGWVTAGEGWHNNHHEFPTSPKLSYKHEFDPAWPIIRLLKDRGLAKTLPTIEERIARRQSTTA